MSMRVEIGKEIVRCERELSGLLQGEADQAAKFRQFNEICRTANFLLQRRVPTQADFDQYIKQCIENFENIRELVQNSGLDNDSKQYLNDFIDFCIENKPRQWKA
jgi:hypothetical protein